MRTFIVLCLVAVACADKLGYNYRPVSHDDNRYSGGNSGNQGIDPRSFTGGDSSFGPADNFSPDSSNLSPAIAGDAGFEKEFFTYTADDADFVEPSASEQIANNLKQALRVIFIKGPENKGLEDAALNLAKSASDQKTAIYILNKQADIGDLANKLNAINNAGNSKPEVHFVKYRTPEDAQNAQSQIQNQYESLGGSSKAVDGGVAPSIDFSSKPAASHGSNYGNTGAQSRPGASYLPANIIRTI